MTNKWRRRWLAIKTDGCSAVPDLWLLPACNNHDRMYSTHRNASHNPITRARADWIFFNEARRANKQCPVASFFIACVYYAGVRLFGAPFWNKHENKEPT